VTSFVGRRQELRDVKRLLTTTRLLTLTGSGGAGKTKLALRAATEMSRGFPGGAWLVTLDSIRDPLLVTQAVFSALGVHDLSTGLSLSSLTDYLASKRLLLVLDNCEHLLDACAVLASTLIVACPDLHVLATSRQALGVAGEVRIVVPPMSLPAEGEETSVQHLLGYDAVGLLSERAAAASPGFTVDAANAEQVLLLCRKLDGIPLALELAAVRLASLSLEQLNRGLASELSILGTGNRGAGARQQTLEAAIGWSYGLLDEQEQRLWARLSVFAGGFEEDAAADVCSDPRIPDERIVGLLGTLVDKSILKRQLPGGGPPRYWLLETMRQYGRERLHELGEETATQIRHFEWVCSLARAIGAWDGRQAELFKRMSGEQDNLWAALDFCQRQPAAAAAGAELARNLLAYWLCRGPYGDVRRMLTALAELAPANSLSRARLLLVCAAVATRQNDYDGCAVLSEESLRIAIEVQDVEAVGWSLTLVAASPSTAREDLAGAAERLESALSLARVMRAWHVELTVANSLCAVLLVAGELDRSVEVGESGLALSQASGELWLRGYLLNYLAQANWLRGHQERSQALAREAAICKQAIDDRHGLAMVLETLAWMAAEADQHERAACLLGSAERARDEISLAVMELFRLQHERTVATTLRRLGQKAFDAAYARGRAMTIDEGVAFAVADKPAPKPAPVKSAPDTALTPRQLEIARLIADDLTNRQIADRLFLSERTVETHITNILNKLGLNSRIQLSRWIAELQETTRS
jgi:non-specific serine/threonine protein kinase